jgi:Flp pilus assembly protein protease CpaA
MRTIGITSALVAALLVASAVCALAGAATTATDLWQGGLVVLAIGAAAFATRWLPPGPWNLGAMEGTAFDDPESFWGRWHRFYTGR